MKFFFDRSGELNAALGQLQAGLDKLSFQDNFQGFEWSGTIAANTETDIPNKTPGRLVPRGFIVVDAEGVNSIVRGSTPWTSNIVSLKNFNTTTAAVVKVFFYR